MNASFEMECKSCNVDLDGKYYYQARLTEEKVCGNCAVIEMSWSVAGNIEGPPSEQPLKKCVMQF